MQLPMIQNNPDDEWYSFWQTSKLRNKFTANVFADSIIKQIIEKIQASSRSQVSIPLIFK